jgi:lipoprotein-releasing system permease protein
VRVPFELTVAARYLWAARKSVHTAFLSLISMLGLAVGVATLLISLALLSGLQGEIKTRLISASPQLKIEPRGGSISNAGEITAELERLGFAPVHPVITAMAWAANSDAGRGRPARVRAEAREERTGATASRELAAALGLGEGDKVVVVSPRTSLTPFGPVPVWRSFEVVELQLTTHSEEPVDLFLPFDAASSLFGTGGEPTSIEAFTPSLLLAEEAQEMLAEKYPSVSVLSWKEINRPLFLALRLEKIVMFATISLIIFVAALNLVSSLSMLIVEKRPQVGTLRTLGATERSIVAIYMTVGLMIGVGGTIIGNVIGLGVAWAANRFGLVPLPGDVYYLSHLPFTIDPAEVIGVNVVAILLSILATLYPAVLAARLDPVTAIREE